MQLKNEDTHFSFENRNIVLEFVNRSAKSTFGQPYTQQQQQWHVCRSIKCVQNYFKSHMGKKTELNEKKRKGERELKIAKPTR